MHHFISYTQAHTKPGCVPVALGSGTQPNTLADAGGVCMRVWYSENTIY